MANRRVDRQPHANSEVPVVALASRETFDDLGEFAWQEGYSVFTVSKSQEEAVKLYIANQQSHHREEDFKSELLKLLRAHGIEFDERYISD